MSNAELFDLLIRESSDRIAKDSTSHLNYHNRFTYFMCIGDYSRALEDIKLASSLIDNRLVYSPAEGVALWKLGRHGEAVDAWNRGIHPKQGRSPNGIDSPALLYFASTQFHDSDLELIAKNLLKQQWSKKLAVTWPWPIASLLLDHINGPELINNWRFANPKLETRRMVRATFWATLQGLQNPNHDSSEAVLDVCDSTDESPLLKILEYEYFLS